LAGISPAPQAAFAAPAYATPQVTGVSFREVTVAGDKVTFTAEISGTGFGSDPNALTSVELLNPTGAVVGTVTAKKITSDNKIEVTAQAPLGTVISSVRLTIGATKIESSSFKLTLKAPAPPPTIKPFEIKHVTRTSPGSPIHSLLVTNENGSFASNPNRMSVEILPAGASNVMLRPGSNPYQAVVDFLAPEKFEVQDVIVTVYDSSDLDKRQPIAIAQPFKEKKPQVDPNQPSISKIDLLSLQRDRGAGRLKIEGSGFGSYRRPPMAAEDFLAIYGTPRNPSTQAVPAEWSNWQRQINDQVRVALVPRNPSLRVGRSQILYIDDKLIDLYFEFTYQGGYSQPFRLASATVTTTKAGTKSLQVLKGDGVVATVEGPETYIVSKDIGARMDDTLSYQYTVLDREQASNLFGGGIADNFYVVKLSVINRGEKKVAIPLAAIQAEIEWADGQYTQGRQQVAGGTGQIEYLEGPDTQTPIPLEDVSGFFDAYNKTKGRKARLFNTLAGVTTLGAALIPFVGPGFRDAHVVFTGGLIPGLRQGLGDLSSQQLQNLTARTWESVEVLSSGGGSVSKYVFIQRGEQFFSGSVKPNVQKAIMNIRGMEVTGFEVTESAPKQATPQQ
jgi:hypothetical protein